MRQPASVLSSLLTSSRAASSHMPKPKPAPAARRNGANALSWKVVPYGERWGLAAFRLVDNLCISTLQLVSHCVAARRHTVAFARLRWVTSDDPVQLTSVDFYVRATLLYRSVDLRPELGSKILCRRH